LPSAITQRKNQIQPGAIRSLGLGPLDHRNDIRVESRPVADNHQPDAVLTQFADFRIEI
jgi:hypothetical protein